MIIEDDEIKIAKGKLQTNGESLPDEVRVPEFAAGEAVVQVATRIVLRGLLPDRKTPLLQEDTVATLTPSAGNWLNVGSKVLLTVKRKTPDLVGKSLKDALNQAKERQLKLTLGEGLEGTKPRYEDVVRSQTPAGGDPIDPEAAIQVWFDRQMPKLIGLKVNDALGKLDQAGFSKPKFFADPSVQDLVADQLPKPGKPTALEQSAELTLARPIPNLVKISLNEAIGKLKSAKLQSRIPNDQLAMIRKNEGIDPGLVYVASQQPELGKGILLPPNFTDTNQLAVLVVLGTKIPNFTQRDPQWCELECRRRLLELVDNRASFPTEAPLKVVRQSAKVDDIVPFGTKVVLEYTLDGSPVPSIIGLTAAEARRVLQQRGLVLNAPVNVNPYHVVREQNPEPDDPANRSFARRGGQVLVSMGVAIPDFVGAARTGTLASARSLADKLGLNIKAELGQTGPFADSDLVQSQSVPVDRPGARQIVKLPFAVSLGLAAQVPPVTGQMLAEAQGNLQKAGLRAEYTNGAAGARVYQQVPKAGTPLPRSSGNLQVHLDLQIQIKNYRGADFYSARQELIAQGMNVPNNPAAHPGDFVFSQDRSGFLNPGTTIRLEPGVRIPRHLIGMTGQEVDPVLANLGIEGHPSPEIVEYTTDLALDNLRRVRNFPPEVRRQPDARGLTHVNMEVIKYVYQEPRVRVRDYTGWNFDQARNDAAQSGLELQGISTRTRIEPGFGPSGQYEEIKVRQHVGPPGPGDPVSKGSLIPVLLERILYRPEPEPRPMNRAVTTYATLGNFGELLGGTYLKVQVSNDGNSATVEVWRVRSQSQVTAMTFTSLSETNGMFQSARMNINDQGVKITLPTSGVGHGTITVGNDNSRPNRYFKPSGGNGGSLGDAASSVEWRLEVPQFK